MFTARLNPTLLEEIGAALSMGVLMITSPLLRLWYARWGAKNDEIRRSLPGDEMVQDPNLVSTRAITIHAPAEKVWPWLAQIGHGRAALYSYERLENLVGCQMKNGDTIVPEWQNPQVGDLIRLGPKGYPLFRIAELYSGQAMVLQACEPASEQPGPATWTFVVEPVDDRTSRLIIRSRNGVEPTLGNFILWRLITDPLSFVMERRLMIGVKRRAEM